MKEEIENPSAFPHSQISALEQEKEARYDFGMTLRDYFAAKAMQALLPDSDFVFVANEAYEMADAMLAERSKK